MACSIYFCGMSWEAAATLIAGTAAVGGAFIIGWFQQAILAAQHNLERVRLKSELFDKRYRIFAEFAFFLDMAADQNSELPTVIEATRQNVERSIFLFDKSIYDHLSPLFQLGQKLQKTPDDLASLQTERIKLHKVFEPYLKLDDEMLRT